jgi:hypothetical protein
MDANSVRKLLRAACKAAGGESNFARQIVLRGAREPRGRILDALNLEAVVVYRHKKSV